MTRTTPSPEPTLRDRAARVARVAFAWARVAAGVGAALGGVAGVGWLLFGSDALRYRDLRIVGNSRASAAQLAHLADLPLGEPLLSLDLDAAVAGVEQHPWVADAQARRTFPDTVVLQVREREVHALLLLDGLYLMDAEGLPFSRAVAGDLDHPVITGLPAALADSDPELARRVVTEALGLLESLRGRPWLQDSDTSEVRFDASAGYTLVLRNGGAVLLGWPSSAPGPAAWQGVLARLDALASNGLSLAAPHRVDLGSPSLAVVTPL